MKQINGRFQTQGHVFRPNCKTLSWPYSCAGMLAVPLVDRLVSPNIDFHWINYISDGMNILIALCTLRKYQTQIFIFKYILKQFISKSMWEDASKTCQACDAKKKKNCFTYLMMHIDIVYNFGLYSIDQGVPLAIQGDICVRWRTRCTLTAVECVLSPL